MWSVNLSRKEFFEFYLGGLRGVESRITPSSGLKISKPDGVTLVWADEPTEFTLPSLAIVPDGHVEQVLVSVLSAPQAPSPLTSLTRVISRESAVSHFDSDLVPLNDNLIPVFCAMSCVEAVLYADGRIGLAQVTPALCRRTISFAWGRALIARASAESMQELPARWLKTHELLTGAGSASVFMKVLSSLVPILISCSELIIGVRPKSGAGMLAHELLWGSRVSQEKSWLSLSRGLDVAVSIDALNSLNREERGLHLQRALKTLSSQSSKVDGEDDALIAACAFLATRLSPGSLDHFEILKAFGNVELMAWYVVFASIQAPRDFLFSRNGLGFKILKGLVLVEDKVAQPSADISFEELSILGRAGSEMRDFAADGQDLQVELIPYVSGSFNVRNRSVGRSSSAATRDQDLLNGSPGSLRDRLFRLARELDRISKEVDGGGYRKRGA